nr:MAG TPA_asm: hypothetical protein [Caudoviricetes sp.]
MIFIYTSFKKRNTPRCYGGVIGVTLKSLKFKHKSMNRRFLWKQIPLPCARISRNA